MGKENVLEKFLSKESIVEDAAVTVDNLEEVPNYYIGKCGNCGSQSCASQSASGSSRSRASASSRNYGVKEESYKQD